MTWDRVFFMAHLMGMYVVFVCMDMPMSMCTVYVMSIRTCMCTTMYDLGLSLKVGENSQILAVFPQTVRPH